MDALQSAGKAYMSINEWGTGPSDVTPAVREFAVAAWLLGNGGHSAVYVSYIQGYGNWTGFPEYQARVGSALGTRQLTGSVWTRQFTSGFAAVNPSDGVETLVKLPGGWKYTDLNGNVVGDSVNLPPGTGVILLATPATSGAAPLSHSPFVAMWLVLLCVVSV